MEDVSAKRISRVCSFNILGKKAMKREEDEYAMKAFVTTCLLAESSSMVDIGN